MSLDAYTIADFSLHGESIGGQAGQTEHRINLVSFWKIAEGSHVLELGCGQGDCTAVLATAVGESGKVTAQDPASLDYGSPYTLGQAQAHLKASPIGSRINFVQATAQEVLAADDTVYDVAVLAHCIWYFASPTVLLDTLRALSTRSKRICLAEYTLSASDQSGVPHVLAALAQAALECRKPNSSANVRTVLSPRRLKEIAVGAGLKLESECVLKAPPKMYDGRWETSHVLNKSFVQEINKVIMDEREKAVIEAFVDSVQASKDCLPEGTKVTTMDVWCSSFVGSV